MDFLGNRTALPLMADRIRQRRRATGRESEFYVTKGALYVPGNDSGSDLSSEDVADDHNVHEMSMGHFENLRTKCV